LQNVITWPAPDTEVPSPDYTVEVDGCPVFVYQARVRADKWPPGEWFGKPITPAERASFVIFDMTGAVTVTVRPTYPFNTAKVLPDRAGIVPESMYGSIRFTLEQPQHLTILLDGTSEQVLHMFISEPEKKIPDPNDPNVLYFGPGLHEIGSIQVLDGQTIYIAGGAVVKAVILPGEIGHKHRFEDAIVYERPMLKVYRVSNVCICGRGILDGSHIPYPDRVPAIHMLDASDVRVEGITLRESPGNVRIIESGNVFVNDVRIICGRTLAGGIRNEESHDVQIRRCFVRNYDSCISSRTDRMQVVNVLIEDCTIWSDYPEFALAVIAHETSVNCITFRRCNIIYATGACLAIFNGDGSNINNIVYQDIDIADQSYSPPLAGPNARYHRKPLLFYAKIVCDRWRPTEAGYITNVLIDGVTMHGEKPLPSELSNYDNYHMVENLTINNVKLNRKPVSNYSDFINHTHHDYESHPS